ncbi:MAG: T9SS type A sorting domain-containing protein, partial [Flavisolibacter sp.]
VADADCANAYVRTRVWNFTDGCGNTSESFTQVITVEDNTAPTFTANTTTPPVAGAINNNSVIEIIYNPSSCGAVFTYTVAAADNCSDEVTLTKMEGPESGAVFEFGTNLVKYSAVDDCGNTSYFQFTVKVVAATTTSTLTVTPGTKQYSDMVTLKVVITGGASQCSGPNAATSATFKIGTQVMKDPNTNATAIPFVVAANNVDLEAVLTTPLLDYVNNFANGVMKPGNKSVTATINGIADEFDVHQPIGKTLTVTQEDAYVVYNGDLIKAAESTNATSVTFDLRAVVYDINYPQNPVNSLFDDYPGDIRNAKIRFTNADGESGVNILNTGWISVADLVQASDKRVGVVNIPGGLIISGLSNNAPSRQIRIGIEVGGDGYYAFSDDIIVTAYLPNGDFITGGGYIVPTESVGRKESDDYKKVNFGFNVKFNKTGKNLQGSMNILFRRTELDGRVHTYQIKPNSMVSLGVNASSPTYQTAEYVAKVTVKDITGNVSNGDADLGGNKMLYVKMVDQGEPGNLDMISFVLVNGTDDPNVYGNIIWSSNWVSSRTQTMYLGGGNLVVHSGFNLGSSSSTQTITGNNKGNKARLDNTAQPFNITLKAYPNPSSDLFNVQVTSDNTHEAIQLRVVDILGRVVEMKNNVAPNSSIQVGAGYKQGVYMVEVMQGDQRRQLKVIKQ